MKICILAPRFPLPEAGGDLLRINNIARYLKSKGHFLILVSYTEREPALEEAKKLYDKIYTVKRHRATSAFYSATALLTGHPIQCGYYYSRSYLKMFREVVSNEQPDLYISHLIRMVPFIKKLHLEDKTIVEMTDALSITYTLTKNAKGSLLKRFMYSIERHLVGRYELGVVKRFRKVVLVSQSDINFLASQVPSAATSLALHTNGVKCATNLQADYDVNKICYIGNMVSLQNQDAAFYFVKEVFPLILKAKPQARFYIVGNNPPSSIQALHDGVHVFVTGFVDDLEGFISDSCLAVAPIRIAAGIQNKVLIAMANGLPVVMTSLITAPIPEIKNEGNCFVADDVLSLSKACIKLMDDPACRSNIAQNGYEMVRSVFSWESKLDGYEDMNYRPLS